MTLKLWQPYPAREVWHMPSVVGTLLVHPDFYSPELDNVRDVLIYLPPSYFASERRYPVIYMQDAQNLFDAGASFVLLDQQVVVRGREVDSGRLDRVLVGRLAHRDPALRAEDLGQQAGSLARTLRDHAQRERR